jgi:hypothetical protein
MGGWEIRRASCDERTWEMGFEDVGGFEARERLLGGYGFRGRSGLMFLHCCQPYELLLGR